MGPREPLGADRGDDRFGESVPEMSTDTRIYESKSLVSVPLMDSTQRMASMKESSVPEAGLAMLSLSGEHMKRMRMEEGAPLHNHMKRQSRTQKKEKEMIVK